MADEKYDLVFRGELVPGADLAQVKQNLSRLFKMDAARVEALFSGKAIVLKRGMEMDAAGAYRVAIKKAGARIDTVLSKPAAPAEAAATKAPVQPPSPEPDTSAQEPISAVQNPIVSKEESPQASDTGVLSLAPVGGDLLAPNEKRQQPEVEVNVSGLSIRPSGESLLDESEREIQVPLPVDLAGLDLAPAGADVLRPEERQAEITADVDLSGFSLAPPGDRLEAPKPAPPPAPDVSGLSLADNG